MMRAFLRKLLILAAAYALALQPVLAAMSAAHARAAVELCSSGQRGDVLPPANAHDDNACCLALGCKISAGADLTPDAGVHPAFAVTDAQPPLTPTPVSTAWPNERPHSARAPPV